MLLLVLFQRIHGNPHHYSAVYGLGVYTGGIAKRFPSPTPCSTKIGTNAGKFEKLLQHISITAAEAVDRESTLLSALSSSLPSPPPLLSASSLSPRAGSSPPDQPELTSQPTRANQPANLPQPFRTSQKQPEPTNQSQPELPSLPPFARNQKEITKKFLRN